MSTTDRSAARGTNVFPLFPDRHASSPVTVTDGHRDEASRAWETIGCAADDALHGMSLGNPHRRLIMEARAACAAAAGAPMLPALEVVR